MIRRLSKFAGITIVALIVLSTYATFVGPWLKARALERADAHAEADAAAARGDLRLVAIDAGHFYTPGAESLQGEALSGRCPYRLVGWRGTDIVISAPIRRLNAAAHSYARSYNARLLTRVPVGRICNHAA